MRTVNKYGKLLLSAYIMKKLKSGVSPKGRGSIRKYIKLAAGAYLLNRLKSGRVGKGVEAEVEPEEMILSEAEKAETGGGSSMKIVKIILGGLAGATLIYALKRHAAKKRGYNIEVE